MKKRIVIIILVLAAAGAGFLFYSAGQQKEAGVLTLYGNVDIRDVALGFRVSGRVAELMFEEGDRVKAGELLAVLDKKPYEDQLAVAAARLEAAAANFAKLSKGLRPQEIEEARAQVSEREATLINLEQTYKRQAELFKLGAVSAQTHDQSLAARDEARARLTMAKKSFELALAGYRDEDIKSAEAEYNAAAASVESAETSLADTEIISPSDGTILTRVREKGSVIASGAAVYTVALDSPVWVRTYVSEPQLGRVHPGQKAEIYTDTNPDKPYTGQVGFISPQAEFTPKSVETTALRTDLVYRLRITVDDPDRALRQGMPVTVKLAE
ncbi:secretion protein HlyD [Geovibrio thiophilus]|uniref:Secretion protein HlyD n=1 Tax=Geovibrio thiophilus TaxID=139438 RepID=A0A410K0R0_9BACT|nr:secretion protein HlyD [Geovibrio thiophilus]QAR33994.1 secretion protein HlyD [Geovibrio thiophilus]